MTRGPPLFASARRVVVTGIGLATPLGVGVDHCWQRLIAGESGLQKIDYSWHKHTKEFDQLPSRIAGLVPRGTGCGEYVPTEWHDDKDARRLPDSIQYGVCAAAQAIKDSGWISEASNPTRSGVAIGCGISGADDMIAAHDTLKSTGLRRVSPFMVPNTLVNMTAGVVSIRHGLKGPNHAVSTACATGAHAIGDAFRFISLGDADMMVCGGTEACISPVVIGGFSRMKALTTTFNESPENGSRPFASDRNGFVIAEGAGMLVLEELGHALDRNAPIYAEIRGYGLTGDAHHISAPSKSGDGALRAMACAIRQAGVNANEIDYINAHATSTPLGDDIEVLAVKNLMKDKHVAVSSTKGATGHMLGAAGSVEAAFTVLSVAKKILPPTRNLSPDNLGEKGGIDFIMGSGKQHNVKVALSNSFGFGGTNASLCFTAFDD